MQVQEFRPNQSQAKSSNIVNKGNKTYRWKTNYWEDRKLHFLNVILWTADCLLSLFLHLNSVFCVWWFMLVLWCLLINNCEMKHFIAINFLISSSFIFLSTKWFVHNNCTCITKSHLLSLSIVKSYTPVWCVGSDIQCNWNEIESFDSLDLYLFIYLRFCL